MSTRRSPALPCAIACTLFATSALAAAAPQDFPQEVLVTDEHLLDPEFDFVRENARFTWINHVNGDVWIGGVDLETGAFVPRDGKGILVGTGGFIIGNGSEWVGGADGHRITYVRLPPSSPPLLAQSRQVQGEWKEEDLVNGQWRILPLGAPFENDPQPTILNLRAAADTEPGISWRRLDFPFSEKFVPLSQGATGARWVPGTRNIVFSAPVNDGRQAFLYDGERETTTQVTFDPGRKQTVFMFEAPEYPGELLMFASVKGYEQSQIRVYRYLDEDGNGTLEWSNMRTFNPPMAGIWFWSPEPFVFDGKTYLFWTASPSPNTRDFSAPTQVWIAGIDESEPYYRNLSEPASNRVRIDPEVFITNQGPFIYFNRYIPASEPNAYDQVHEGIYRVDTGLGMQEQGNRSFVEPPAGAAAEDK